MLMLQFCIMPTDKRSPSFVFYVAKTRTSDLVLVQTHAHTHQLKHTHTLTRLHLGADNAAVYWKPRHVHEEKKTGHNGGPADEGSNSLLVLLDNFAYVRM